MVQPKDLRKLKFKKITSVGTYVEKLELLCTADVNVKWAVAVEKWDDDSQKIKHTITM